MSALRVEYLKARARKKRYREEVIYTRYDKERTLVSAEKDALTWDRREGQAVSLKSCPIVAAGAAAFAAERASSFRSLSAKFKGIWTGGRVAAPLISAPPSETEQPEETEDDLHFTVAADIDSDNDVRVLDDDSDAEAL